MSEWRTIRLEDGLECLIDYRGKSPPKSKTGIPVISAKVVKDGRVVQPIEQTIDPNYYPIWMTRGLPCVGDIVMTTEGPLGEVAQLDTETVKFAIAQRIICMRGKKGVIDNTFLKFFLMSPIQQQLLSSYSTGTTVAGISQKALRSIPISVPNYSAQVAIGSLLGALDDKIELNRRMNDTLEAMAQAIFKDWFVDFGPARAKMEGRTPYLSAEIWSLFPDRIDPDGLPDGWKWVQLQEVVELNPSEAIKRGENAPYLDMAALPTSGPTPDQAILREFTSGTRFRNGDALLARITPCLENGKTAFVQSLPKNAIAWGSTEFVVLRSRSPVPPAYSYLLARDPSFRAHSIQSMTGTSGRQRARTEALASYPVARPSDEAIWSAFGSVIEPLFDRIRLNGEEARTLAQTRDLLLPKLMSGEIRIRDAEKTVEAAA